ncbi:hypothetical protein H0H92_004243 [Tricholoma furcatifolium]|nr:hypothetical protein H0H92_004243 [Tricholoma furcatifolium]
MTITDIKSLDEFREIIKSETPIIIDFTSKRCGPCIAISPLYQKLSAQHSSVGFYTVDIEDQKEVSEEFEVYSMPTFILYQNGEKIQEFEGAYIQKLKVNIGKTDENDQSRISGSLQISLEIVRLRG